MSDRAQDPRTPGADGRAVWKAPQWGAEAPGPGGVSGLRQVDLKQRETELTRFVGSMTARGWSQVHRMPGAVLLVQAQHGNGVTAVGLGATGVAAGAAVGGAVLLGVLAGIGMIVFGALLTLTVIGAIAGIPMIMTGAAVFTGGTAAATAGGAAGAAVGVGAASRDQTLRLQAWTDETGRIFIKSV